MVEFLTRAKLRALAAARTNFTEAALIQRSASRSPVGSTFLSHSTKDADLLPGAITLLENHGALVYIDKKDPALPPYTNRRTATILRDRIDQCRKFVLLVSVNSKDSRWMPWELGLADGYKRSKSVAILPSPEQQSETSWTSQEYLGVYDRIVFGPLEGRIGSVYKVQNTEAGTAVELSDWLKRP